MATQPFGNLVSKAFGIGEAAAAIHIQEISRAVVKVGQGQGVLLAEGAFGLRLQEGALIIREGHGEKGIRIADKFVNVSLPGHLSERTPFYKAQVEQGWQGKKKRYF